MVIGAIVLAGGAVGGGVALASGSRSHVPASSPGGPATTAAVVRTNLINTVQVGGSIGYNGSYTVAAPSGASASTVAQDQQAVAEDEQALSADEQAESDASASGNQAVAAAQANVEHRPVRAHRGSGRGGQGVRRVGGVVVGVQPATNRRSARTRPR